MATSKGKLSLRRKNKESANQPVAKPAVQSTSIGSTSQTPVVVADKLTAGLEQLKGGERGRKRREVQEEEEEEKEDELQDFRPKRNVSRVGVGKKRKMPQPETAEYMDMVSEDQLQLALAMSASLNPPLSVPVSPRSSGRKRSKQRKDDVPTKLLKTSEIEKNNILAQRASEILQERAGSAEKSVPRARSYSLQPSQLGKIVNEGSSEKTATLWDIAGYSEKDARNKFVVDALDLPLPELTSHTPSPPPPLPPPPPVLLSQSSVSSSPAHSPQPRPHHSPPPPPPLPTLQPSHTPLNSQTKAPDHHPHHSQSHQFHSSLSSHPPSSRPHLPRGIKTLLSDLSSLVGSQLCSDVIITVNDGRGIPAHSAILACRCPMLAERLFHSLDKPVRLNFSQYSRPVVVAFLQYLYTGSLPSQLDKLKAIKTLASSVGMAEPVEEKDEQQPHPLIQRLPPDPDTRTSFSPSPSRHSISRTLNLRGSPLMSKKGVATPPQSETLPIISSPVDRDVIDVTNTPSPQSPSHPPLPSSFPPVSLDISFDSTSFSPLPLWQRLASKPHPLVGVASPPTPPASVPAMAPPSLLSKGPPPAPPQLDGLISGPSSKFLISETPVMTGQRPVLESDTDLTPMPDYTAMDTPHLKGECSRFGVRPLPKKKMIAKLTEIYDYTHPLTDEHGNIVSSTLEETSSSGAGAKEKRKNKAPAKSSEKPTLEELAGKVREVITQDTKLYEDILQYKPLELSYIQSRLKTAALSLSKDSLMDVLDHLCITFSQPRQNQQQPKKD